MDTNSQNVIEIEQLEKGVAVLSNLAEQEYDQDLASILMDPTRTQDERLVRVGRLLGVILKEPFASAVPIVDPGTSVTGAYRGWALDASAFDIPEKQTTWQYEVLEALRKEEGAPTVYDLAQMLQYERGFFACLAASTSKYICGDPALKQKIDADLKASQQSGGVGLAIQAALSTGIADMLVHYVPALAAGGLSAIPIVSGLVLVISVTSKDIGIDAFCSWVAQYAPPYVGRGHDEI